MEELISEYGYLAVFIGTFLEGETILILGGFAAFRGYLSLEWVIAVAIVGSVAGDQLAFLLGRTKGRSFVARRPRLEARLARVRAMLTRHELLVLLTFRFLYGLRNAIPIALGMSPIHLRRFVIFNVIGAVIWAFALGIGGYLFGRAFERLVGDIQRYELWAVAGLIAIGLLLYGLRRFLRWRASRGQPPVDPAPARSSEGG